jgi:hypothetical protein
MTFIEFIVRHFFVRLCFLALSWFAWFHLSNALFLFTGALLCSHIMMLYHSIAILAFEFAHPIIKLEMFEFAESLTSSDKKSFRFLLSIFRFRHFCFFKLHKYFNGVFKFKRAIFQRCIYALRSEHCSHLQKRIVLIDSKKYFIWPFIDLSSALFWCDCSPKFTVPEEEIWTYKERRRSVFRWYLERVMQMSSHFFDESLHRSWEDCFWTLRSIASLCQALE